MRIILSILILSALCLACSNPGDKNFENGAEDQENEMVFDKTKWIRKEGEDYLFRDKMVNRIVHNDTIRTLNKNEILFLLGEPDRINENHLYYTISQKRLGFWPIHTKTMVIKFKTVDAIDWIKIHE
jgi:hypothetical protein